MDGMGSASGFAHLGEPCRPEMTTLLVVHRDSSCRVGKSEALPARRWLHAPSLGKTKPFRPDRPKAEHPYYSL
jgi:hypothetical protein